MAVPSVQVNPSPSRFNPPIVASCCLVPYLRHSGTHNCPKVYRWRDGGAPERASKTRKWLCTFLLEREERRRENARERENRRTRRSGRGEKEEEKEEMERGVS